jgi:UDP:flavonoid glycosyltransferase YjiC (YdhE family)
LGADFRFVHAPILFNEKELGYPPKKYRMNLLIPLFSPATGTWGGLTRVIAIAEAAQQSGHQVAFCASGYLSHSLKQRGFAVYPVPPATMFGLPTPLSRIVEKRSQQARLPVKPGKDFGNIWFVLFLSGMARNGYLRRLVEAEHRAAQEFKADFIFTDLDPGAYLLAQICGLPIATAYQSPMREGVGSLPWKLMNRTIFSLLKKYHFSSQTADELFFGPQVLKIIPSIPELESTDPSRVDVCYVGQLLGNIKVGDGFKPNAGKRYIFVYLGTGAVPLTTAKKLLPQVFPANGKYICLVAAQSVNAVEQIGGVEFLPYVPAANVLPHCDWTICHGGQNTITQSLINGVPLMIFPGPIFERRFNARKVQATGAGLMGELNEFTAEWIEAALEKQNSCAGDAIQLGRKIRSYGGALEAIKAMVLWREDRNGY